MSRSKRKTPIYGICGGSEKEDKRIWHRRFRRKEKVALSKQHDEHISTDHREVSNPWSMSKDGKMYWSEVDQQRFRDQYPSAVYKPWFYKFK